MLQACHGQSHDHGGQGNRGVSDVKGIILCRKCPWNWCLGWGLVGNPWTHQTTTTTVLQFTKGFLFVCFVLFVCFEGLRYLKS